MRSFWSVLAVSAAVVVAPAVQAETLADAMVSAYKSSNLLDQNRAVLRAADEDAAIALSRLRPVVDFTAQGGWAKYDNAFASASLPQPYYEGFSGSMNLSASILIWAGGRGKLSVDLARESVLSTRAALVNVEQQVLLGAVSAFVNVRLQLEIVDLRESNVRLIGQELKAARDRFEVGEVTKTDVSLAEAQLAAARANLAAAQGQLAMAREAYKAATGHYPNRLSGLPRLPATAKSLDGARAVALRTHPFIIQSQHDAKAAELQVAIAKTGVLPTIAGSVGVSENLSSGLGNTSIGLSFNQPIYHGGEISAMYRKALAGKEIAQAGLHQTAVNVGQNVGNAWANLAVAGASIAAGSGQVTAAQAAFDGVREEAALGARTTLDVLNAEQDLSDARATKLQAEANRYVGTYQLLSAMGLLTADHLKLGVPSYDPEAYYNAVKTAPATSVQGKRLDKILGKIGN